MADIPVFTLNNGIKMPSVGLGCWTNMVKGHRVLNMCRLALKNGYRHFDTADMYGNEGEVGQAVRESGIPRSEIFITTKLNNDCHHKVRESFEKSLKALDLEYTDLYLMHWPQAQKEDGTAIQPGESPTFVETWKEMEKLLDTGKVRAIGISNFFPKTLDERLPQCKIIPATNQIEMHPSMPQEELKRYCNEKGILLTAYSPLGQQQRIFLEDEDLVAVANKHKVTPAQVALSWGVQRGTAVIPKSENEARIKQNITLVKLSDEDMQAIDSIHEQPKMHRSLCQFPREKGEIFGWTPEQLGWNLDAENCTYAI